LTAASPVTQPLVFHYFRLSDFGLPSSDFRLPKHLINSDVVVIRIFRYGNLNGTIQTLKNASGLLSTIIMKKNILLFICSLMLSCGVISARITQQQAIEDSGFGWLKVYNLKGAKENKKIDSRVFIIAQLSVCDSFG
jgi:hypothetical protein